MSKGWVLAIAGILIMLCMVQTMEARPPPGDDPEWYDGPDWPEKGMEFHDDLYMNYSREGPRMGFKPGMMPPFFSFAAFEILFFNGSEQEEMDLEQEDWNISFRPLQRSMRYKTELFLKRTAPAGMNRTIIDLDFKPILSEEGRKVIYNLTMKENLTMDKISVKWRFDIDRDSIEEQLNRDLPEWDWNHQPDRSSLDSIEGEELATMHWDKMARFRNATGETFNPVESMQEVEEEDLVVEVTMDVGNQVSLIEAGGFLEFLDPLFNLLGTSSDEVNDLLKDHAISILIGVAAMTTIFVLIIPVMARKNATSDPLNELDYKKSRFYRKD